MKRFAKQIFFLSCSSRICFGCGYGQQYNESPTCISHFLFSMKTEEPLQYFAKIKIAQKHGLILEFITLCGFRLPRQTDLIVI